MAMQMYMSSLLDENSAKTIVLVRDDAKVEQHRRRKFNFIEQTSSSTCQWNPRSKSRAPTLPCRMASCEDLHTVQRPGKLKDLSTTNASFAVLEEDGCPGRRFDLNPIDTISNETEDDDFDSPTSLHQIASSLGDILARSPIPLDPTDQTTTNFLGNRATDYISLSHTQHLNLTGKVDRAGSHGKARNAHAEAAPVIPFRKESIDDFSKRRQELGEGLDSTILNFTWEPLQDETSKDATKERFLRFYAGTLSDEERCSPLHDPPQSEDALFANLASSTEPLPANIPNDNSKTQSPSFGFETLVLCLQDRTDEGVMEGHLAANFAPLSRTHSFDE